ncbi:50S ribosomal protein L21 [Entomospira culicis]|uniref:Large ribosomal subunit protein bL21 n=1 Tax=Entomospira culicis TaxID=2719989 RepID=A0A968KZZ6_9SPIO|nr:50S ribosomal protein L21 [Entomospira culicis]NIZ19279.1 50S ribosomal protein L21 [Entomospira culicis]NIZ69816.1 50S ribosomal protein L21 [Entomospira culicis]WDI36923.1 50S ribosomal protein L21 [Entomospira culicis]WDI38552.1 50S ribosomal protein L21 [Entomospira culicis]
MYAVVEIKGKQYKAQEGKYMLVDLHAEHAEGTKLEFPVFLLSDGEGKVSVGKPHVEGAKVTVKVMESLKDKKIRVFKYKRRKGYRKTMGHRQNYTKLLVEKVSS